MKKFAIVGYGNIGKACAKRLKNLRDVELVGIFSRRDITSEFAPVYPQKSIFDFSLEVIICTGSANDVTELAKKLVCNFNTVDSFDTHAKMREYVEDMDRLAKEHGHLAIVGAGWDPGIFSLARALFFGVTGVDAQTFWGPGVSQGHSEAIRRIEGVEDAVQYTIPIDGAIERIRRGETGLSDRQKHRRVCFVALKRGANRDAVREKIVSMPNYFAPYDVEVNFVEKEELKAHAAMPHAGIIMGRDKEGQSNLELSLKLKSNPEFTSGVLVSYALAASKLDMTGAYTLPELPVSILLDDVMKFV